MNECDVKGIDYYKLPPEIRGYACIHDKTLYLSAIKSKEPGKGTFRRFLDKVEGEFDVIKVPTPSMRMREILTKRGYLTTEEYSKEMEDVVEIMMKKRDKVKG